MGVLAPGLKGQLRRHGNQTGVSCWPLSWRARCSRVVLPLGSEFVVVGEGAEGVEWLEPWPKLRATCWRKSSARLIQTYSCFAGSKAVRVFLPIIHERLSRSAGTGS